MTTSMQVQSALLSSTLIMKRLNTGVSAAAAAVVLVLVVLVLVLVLVLVPVLVLVLVRVLMAAAVAAAAVVVAAAAAGVYTPNQHRGGRSLAAREVRRQQQHWQGYRVCTRDQLAPRIAAHRPISEDTIRQRPTICWV
jgi:hypothetical protein